jgi:hypothetical protein
LLSCFRIWHLPSLFRDPAHEDIQRALPLAEDAQWAIVERFTKADLGRVRNKTGYLIGILKIARQGKVSATDAHSPRFKHCRVDPFSFI